MKLLILSTSYHHKNKTGLESILNNTGIKYTYGNISEIEEYDIIYSPVNPVVTSNYPDKKFIFGPHFSVFPDSKLSIINNMHNNCVYIQPSVWVRELWKNMNAASYVPIKAFPFPVDMTRFSPNDNKCRDKVFIYVKRRNPEELIYIKNFLKAKQIDYKIFDYVKRYNEGEYLDYLQQSKYGIILDAHESQGFAIEEALSCDVPLFVWNVRFMSQEHGSIYQNIPCTTIPYWDDRCGEFFYDKNEFETTFETFVNKLDTYHPRQYILENLSVDKCSERFIDLIK
jgi:hypothetical protein